MFTILVLGTCFIILCVFQDLCNCIKKSQLKHLVCQTLIERSRTPQNIQFLISENLFRSVGTFLGLSLSHIFPSHLWECVWILVYLILILNHFPYHALTFSLHKTNKNIGKNIKQKVGPKSIWNCVTPPILKYAKTTQINSK